MGVPDWDIIGDAIFTISVLTDRPDDDDDDDDEFRFNTG